MSNAIFFVTDRDSLRALASQSGAACAGDFASALKALETGRFAILVFDFASKDVSAIQVLDWLKARPVTALIAATGVSPDKVSVALHLGVQKFLPSEPEPFKNGLAELVDDVQAMQVLSHAGAVDALWIGQHPLIRDALVCAKVYMASGLSFAVLGEVGSGRKSLVRMAKMASQELWIFGDEPDAISRWASCSQSATLCITDPAELPLAYQSVVATTLAAGLHRLIYLAPVSLSVLVAGGRLQDDLAIYLSARTIKLPSLRERSEDLVLLAEAFLPSGYAFAADAWEALKAYPWPGNVGEFKDLVAKLAQLPAGSLRARSLPPAILERGFYRADDTRETLGDLSYADAKRVALEEFHRRYLEEVLVQAKHNLTVAAEKAGMDRSNFKKILRKSGKMDAE